MKEITKRLHKTIKQHGGRLFEIDNGSDKVKLVLSNDEPMLHGKIVKPYRIFAYKMKAPEIDNKVLHGLEMAYIHDNNIAQISGDKWK